MSETVRRRVHETIIAGGLTLLLAGPSLAQVTGPNPLVRPVAPRAGGQTAPAGPALRLSMEEAVDLALRNNLGLESARLDTEVADFSIASARAAFLPQVQGSFSRTTSTSVPFDFTQGSTDIQSRNTSAGGGFGQLVPWYGGSYSVSWSGSRNSTEGGNSSFNPRLNSTLRMNYSQPLLRGFRVNSARIGVETSERQRAITDIQVEQNVVATEAAVRLAYLNLVGAIENQKVVQGNLDIRLQALENARARVRVGVAPQIDVIQAEADVATNQEAVIRAGALVLAAEDDLRTLILDPAQPDYWTTRLEPTDEITLEPRTIDLDGAIRNALTNRLDLEVRRRNLQITDLNLRLANNNTLPTVDLDLSYSASGTGGTQLQFGSGFPPEVIGETKRSFTSVLNDTFLGEYPTWTVAVNVGYPIGQTAARAAHASAQVQKRQQELLLRQSEIQIVQQVRDAARTVQNAFERIQATQAALQATQEQLDAENRRFEQGLSTTLDLQFRQQQLAQARVAELSARIDYARALIVFERVQKTN